VLRPRLDAQVAFNSRQTQLDNALLEWLVARFAATHDHYDRLHHAATGRMNDIDERHLILQEHVVAHVHELVRRIDFVLEASERSRLSAETDLKRLAVRIEELEKRLAGR
jgi:DNA-binding ferritin-like protein